MKTQTQPQLPEFPINSLPQAMNAVPPRLIEWKIPMKRRLESLGLLLSALAFVFTFNTASHAEAKRQLITQGIDQSRLVTLAGNTRPEATAANDRGRVPDDFAMSRMLLLLRRPPELEAAFAKRLKDLHDPASPNYYRWLTATQVGQMYGSAPQDVSTIEAWLRSQGFTVDTVYDNGIVIAFSGTAGQVSEAFHTEIHQLDVQGEHHIANMSDPKIPEALAPAVVGVVSLNDFMPHPMLTAVKPQTVDLGSSPSPDYTTAGCGSDCYLVVPSDLSTIYNFPPHLTGRMGENRTVVLIEDTDVYSTSTHRYDADWQTFRKAFGLSSYPASFRQVHPGPGCLDPGINGADGEAILDVEWATAAAPAANMKLAACKDVLLFGGFLALQNILQEAPLPDAVSISYGEAETDIGATYNAYINSLYSYASAVGVSVYVAAGDSGAALNDDHQSYASYGINVNAFASTPNNVAVGGTDFEDTYLNQNSTYWNATNNTYYGSATSYIPEIPWNDSCAGALLALYHGYSSPLQFCNTGQYLYTAAGSGGPSACATGTPSTLGVVGGTCAGYPKPDFQSLSGVPNDGVRDLPDVSLFAANGVWGHYYVYCFSDPKHGGSPCTGLPSTWSGGGGTSFASPIWAGIQALLNQKIKSSSGNPNYNLYSIANTDGLYLNGDCNSDSLNGPRNTCNFNDVTQGDMDVPCRALNGVLHNCYLPSGETNGLLSTSNSSLLPAYGTTTGWDFATGIGTVNVQNLVTNWPPPPATCAPYVC
jgi:subtilase family serine protease